MNPKDYENSFNDEMTSKAFAIEVFKEISERFGFEYEIIDSFGKPAMVAGIINICIDGGLCLRYHENTKNSAYYNLYYNFKIAMNDDYLDNIEKVLSVIPFMNDSMIAWDPGIDHRNRMEIIPSIKERLLILASKYRYPLYIIASIITAISGLYIGMNL